MLPEMPFHPMKPIKGGPPLSALYRQLASSPDWMCQAKLDGHRVLWDGKVLWSRHGNRLDNAVAQALEGVDMTLDGELMGGREMFVYDLPDLARRQLQERWKRIPQVVSSINSTIIRVCPVVHNWEEVTDNQWEGVVFKKVNSLYPMGRSEGQETTDWVKFRAEWL